MPIGPTIRRMLGPLEEPISRLYRAIFVNVDAVARELDRLVPHGARIIDVGGGDGMILNALLRRRPDLTASVLDLSPDIGRFIAPEVADRVTLHPATAMADYRGDTADVVMICDVLHHVPPAARPAFMTEARALVRPGGALIVKDVSPFHIRGWLGYLSDRYVSGDRGVSLVAPADVSALVEGTLDGTGGGRANYVSRYRI